MNTEEDEGKFRELLETEYNWPANYTFKFIVPASQLNAVKQLFEADCDLKIKDSSGGKYKSVTIVGLMLDADSIIEIYKRASAIEGIISL